MKRHHILGLIAIIIVLAACQKDKTKTDTAAAIEGSYTFKSLSAKTISTITGSDGEKSVTNSDYTSTNNKGTIVFGNSKMSSTDLSYTVNTTATGYFYQDNEFIDSLSYPFTFTWPASTSVSSYQLIGKDSIYFPNGSIASSSGTVTSTGPSGTHYTLSGNVLTFMQAVSKDSSFTDSGVNFHVIESAQTSIVMEKQ